MIWYLQGAGKKDHTDAGPMTDAPLWIFGYGSLMWQPEFVSDAHQIARLAGYRRRFCMWSYHYRGSRAAPGLVLALDARAGAFCEGVAFRVPAGAADETLAYLRTRELISDAYLEARLPVRLRSGCVVQAVTYVINTAHEQFCAGLAPEDEARIIAAAKGTRGPNAAYLANTARHLRALGIEDAALTSLAARVEKLRRRG